MTLQRFCIEISLENINTEHNKIVDHDPTTLLKFEEMEGMFLKRENGGY